MFNNYWLRTPGDTGYAAVVIPEDNVYADGLSVDGSHRVRPAFHLDLNAVLLTSAARVEKASGPVGPGALTAVGTTANNEWKLTLKDSGRTFSVSQRSVAGNVATFSYVTNRVGANEYISAIIKNGSDEITHYGRIAQPAAVSGVASVDLTAGLSAAVKIYVFSEQVNGNIDTDLASALVEIPLQGSAGSHTVTFDPNGGAVSPMTGATDTDGKLTSLPTPARGGYAFEGWWTEAAGGVQVSTGTVFFDNATVYAHWTPTGGTVTVLNDGNGTALASADRAASDDVVMIVASANVGYTFKEWTTSTSGVTFYDSNSASTFFNMPSMDVTVTATFKAEPTPPNAHTVSVDVSDIKSGTALASPKTSASGDVVTLLASPNSGYTFKEWTTNDGVTFANKDSASTTFTMPNEAVTVTATFELDNGGGEGGGGTPTSVGLDEEALSLKAGETAKLTATVEPAGAAVVWASTAPGVASVSPDGTVTAYKAGMAVITATAGGRLAFCVVTVTGEGTPGPGPEVVSIALDKTSMDLSVGDAATLTATVDPAGAAVTWGSSDPGVASVTGGTVTGEKAGMAVVVATAGGRLAFCVVTVVGEDGTPGGSGGGCFTVGFGGVAMIACASLILRRRS